MGLLRRRATDYFVVLLGCLVKAPMGYKMRVEDEKKGGGKKMGIIVEKRRHDRKSQRRAERR